MVWLYPAAAVGLIAIAAPVLIHLLVHRRATPILFPTLRFLQATRLASIRRRLLAEVPLLLVRAAIVTAALAAVAGPLFVTAARLARWNGRIARAVVATEQAVGAPDPDLADSFRSTLIETRDCAEGMRRATAWLGQSPPAAREIVVRSAFPLGCLTEVDIAAVPKEVGIRLIRVGSLPGELTIESEPALGVSTAADRGSLHRVTTSLVGERTRVQDFTDGDTSLPVEVVAPRESAPSIAAALTSVLSQRVFAPASGRAARFLLAGSETFERELTAATPATDRWMADAVAAILRDDELARYARDVGVGFDDRRLAQAPWRTLLATSDGRPIASAAAGGGRLIVASAAPATNLLTPLLLRSIFNALAPRDRSSRAEVMTIPDRDLIRWERRPGSVNTLELRRVEQDDRRWFWSIALLLLAFEHWFRNTREERLTR